MPTTTLQAPPELADINHVTWRQWFRKLQRRNRLITQDTSAGNQSYALESARDNLDVELVFLKSTSDGNTYTITGAEGGNIVISTFRGYARVRSDGAKWWKVG